MTKISKIENLSEVLRDKPPVPVEEEKEDGREPKSPNKELPSN